MPEPEEQKKVSNNNLPNSQFGGGFINAEQVNAGRIGGDIFNFFFNQQATKPVGNPNRPENQRLLLAAVKTEVAARLRQSLHNAVLINLDKEPQPQQVKRPWDADIKIGLKPAVPLPDSTTILEVFDSQEIVGKLLILGAPGSGKTTTQLELAQELIKRAEEQPDYPVPVLFNLSSWKDDRQSLADWLVVELKSKYGVSKKLGQDCVNNRQLLPLLDGLDEIEPQRQELCVQSINQFLGSETRPLYLVVCSRIEEYSNYTSQLQLNGAIYLQPLSNNQIYDFLTFINYTEFWITISSDLDLLELVKTPLLLSITVLASQEISVEKWQNLTFTTDRIQYLLDAYIVRMLARDIDSQAYLKTKLPNVRKTRMWLVWLAKQMQEESKTEFLIEEMQPSLLEIKAQKRMYKVIVRLIHGLFYGLFYGLIMGLINGLYSGLYGMFILLFLWMGRGLYRGQTDFIENKKTSNQGIWKSAKNAVFYGLIGGLIWGLLLWLIVWLIFRHTLGLIGGLIYVLIGVLINGLFFGGLTCIHHFILRLILHSYGYIPWNYARFLDYCTERLLLQRVGGRYRFVHKMLQDHFAQMEFKRD